MTELASALARQGAEVHYVAEVALSEERRRMGWKTQDLAEVQVHFISTRTDARDLVDGFPSYAVHITQGVRSNGLVAEAQRRISALRRRHYPIMEKVDLRSLSGLIKPLIYALRFRSMEEGIEGILAIGEGTDDWIARLAPRKVRVFPFAYFLGSRLANRTTISCESFKFIFVGSLVRRKRVDLLLEALSTLATRHFLLEIVGDGPERSKLEEQAQASLPGCVVFTGSLAMGNAIERIAAADCLVLPSDQDGWGAVVSEAQINGTPVICSSQCGAAGTVRASGFGGVFEAGSVDDLRDKLSAMLDQGCLRTEMRDRLSDWAHCLTAKAGARYLSEILLTDSRDQTAVVAPWIRSTGENIPK